MTAKNTQPKHLRLLEAMIKGQTFTIAQIRSRFKAGNPYQLISALRKVGVEIKSEMNQKTRRNRYSL